MTTSSPSSSSFESLGLPAPVLQALHAAQHAKPTPIQEQAIPPALEGKDVIGCAATGTGKTAAFLLPIIARLAGRQGTRALVLAPTRELAIQINEQLARLGGTSRVRGTVIIGGVSQRTQVAALSSAPEVIIATPGRLVDHLTERTANLAGIELLVLDEADRMLDMGFKPQLSRILERLPRKRQTLLFSATMQGEVADFAKAHLLHPVRVEVAASGTTAARAEQSVYLLPQAEKTALLLALLQLQTDDSVLVFTRTKHRADKVARSIEKAGHAASRLHADRSQSQRRQALDGFKAGKYRVLVATDIAARGIDVEEISHVINFDLPHVPEDYVHRVGRTARAAASGRASSFCSPEETALLRDIERFTRNPLPRRDIPRDSAAFQSELTENAAARVAAPRLARPAVPRADRPAARPQRAAVRRSR